jgi:hypothetical protein
MMKKYICLVIIACSSAAFGSEITTYEYKPGNGITISLNEDKSCDYDDVLLAGVAIIPNSKEINEICWTWIDRGDERFALLFTPNKEFAETVPENKLTQKILDLGE